MLFKHKSTVKVHMADLFSEKEKLATFLLQEFKLNSKETSYGLELDNVPTFSLVKMVTKYLQHNNLNNKYWVSAENHEIKINRFKHEKKAKENKHPITPSIIKHGF